ncbi:Uncharacterised protein [Suttonella indologenes]|uniref:Uncharacterized protein n=1 Tax=Suttonella indologenes TaxID=13276 RepID=A0A380MIM1_9GAMM|nr:Uncharacterised protein [Suttonella indologenes]
MIEVNANAELALAICMVMIIILSSPLLVGFFKSRKP